MPINIQCCEVKQSFKQSNRYGCAMCIVGSFFKLTLASLKFR